MKVVIVGGGFGGLQAAKKLANRDGVEVTLVDRRNHHLFQPLLYQVASAGLSPAEIASPIRAILRGARNVRVVLDEITDIDLAGKAAIGRGGTYAFDKLVLATGAEHSYFGRDEWEEWAPGLKTIEQATEIRRRILLAFEEAEKETDPLRQREWMTFVIVGGGPTGVELAGAIAEISRTTLERDFRRIDPSRTRVLLVEAGARVLAAFDERLSDRARRDLEGMGVEIRVGTRVSEVSGEGVRMGEEAVRAKTIVWAAGVEASPLGKRLGLDTDRAGRVPVNADLSTKASPDIFVIGDLANFPWGNSSLPGLAPVAMQQGRHVARNILNDLRGNPRRPFRYVDKGLMATIGRRRAVVQTGSLRLTGFIAWVAWLFIHIFYLIGFHNRVIVFLQWAWSYVTFKRGARLIASHDWKKTRSKSP